jgi:putative ABC transport system ATP-binding protein
MTAAPDVSPQGEQRLSPPGRCAADAPRENVFGMTTSVALHEVRATYGIGERRVTALAGVSAEFDAGTFTAVMGPSGSGKSTLLHCAAALERPSGGTVTVDGTDLGPLDETARTHLRRDRIGVIFQDYNLLSSLTAAQNVALPLRLAGRKPKPEEVAEALEAVGLAGRSAHRPSELSGGERQRVAIARTIIARPAVVLADEPTGALDSNTSRHVLELLRGLVDTHGRTVVLVTHDPVAAGYADRVLLLADGRLVDELSDVDAGHIAARMAALEATC